MHFLLPMEPAKAVTASAESIQPYLKISTTVPFIPNLSGLPAPHIPSLIGAQIPYNPFPTTTEVVRQTLARKRRAGNQSGKLHRLRQA